MWGIVGVVLGLLGAVMAAYSVFLRHREPLELEERTLRAFKRLEADVEDLFERVESHLGRISRLKRETKAREVVNGSESSIPGGASAAVGSRTRSSLLTTFRRSNVSQSNVSRANGAR